VVDDLIAPGSTGPWVDLVLDKVEPSKWLHQGDMLVDIRIPVFKALLDVQNDPTPEIPVDVGTIVVMTQSCDLENRKAPMVACCPVHTLAEFESFNERFKRMGEWENVRRGKIAGLHLVPGADIENNRTCLVVDFRVIHSLTIEHVIEFIKDVGHHPRLKSPYVEHMSQAFARLFMRVGLPVDIPPFK
jgi:hypothetical protein